MLGLILLLFGLLGNIKTRKSESVFVKKLEHDGARKLASGRRNVPWDAVGGQQP